MAHGAIHWSECITKDIEGAKKHYSALLGWTYEAMPMEGGTYWIIKKGDDVVGGMMSMEALPPGVPPHWMTYMEVEDINAAVETAKSSGGRVEREPWEIPGVGHIAMIADPGGALAGYVQPPRENAG